MGFLDNSSITVDAILTKYGKRKFIINVCFVVVIQHSSSISICPSECHFFAVSFTPYIHPAISALVIRSQETAISFCRRILMKSFLSSSYNDLYCHLYHSNMWGAHKSYGYNIHNYSLMSN